MTIETMKLALAFVEGELTLPERDTEPSWNKEYKAQMENLIAKLRAAIEQAEKPVAWADKYDIEREGHDFYVNRQQPAKDGVPLYTAPPQPDLAKVGEVGVWGERQWQGLTENEIKHLWYEACQTNLELTSQLIVHLAGNIEAKLREKNNA